MSDPSVIEATRRLYDTVARRRPHVPFLNFGFVESGVAPPDTKDPTEMLEMCRRLYEAVLMPLPPATDVFEAGCGRGGGAAFLLDRHPSLNYLGLDLSSEHLRVCRDRFASNPNARFAQANASQLPIADASFDVAFSVEAAHHFDDRPRFYREVARALRPGGWLLLTGLWPPSQKLTEAFDEAGFAVVEQVDITANVVAALTSTSDLRQEMTDSLELPERFTPMLMSWAGVRGYGVYDGLAARTLLYLRFRLQRK